MTASLAPGTLFARDFRIVAPLGAGGMGAVYVAEQVSTGQRRALKVMQASLVRDPKLRDRFLLEARIGARVASEHVVSVVAAGIDEESESPWLAMELLEGEELSAKIEREGAFAPSVVLEILEQVGHAVGAAHAAGIVHRDLKPENIFIATSKRLGARSIVKVLDFGIAKVVADAKSADTAPIGSPRWMAPEQTSRGTAIGPPCDVWAIGLLAFHMLTNRYFWRALDDADASLSNLLREIVLDPIPKASDRAREMGCADLLPRGMDAWFEQSLHREPQRRYADATAQLDALREILGGVKDGTAAAPHAGSERPAARSHPSSFVTDATDVSGAANMALAPTESALPSDVTPTPALPATPASTVAPPPRSRALVAGAAAILLGGGVAAYGFSRPAHDARPLDPIASANVPAMLSPSSNAALSDASTFDFTAGSDAGADAAISDASADATTSDAGAGDAGKPPRPLRYFEKMDAFEAVNLSNPQSCGGERMSVWIDFAHDGHVKNVRITDGPQPGTPVGDCVVSKIRSVKIAPFDGPYGQMPYRVH